MPHKQSRQSKPHHRPHRRSYQPLPSKSPHRRRGRSQSKPSRRARSSSVRLHSRAVTPARFHSRSRSRPRRAVRTRDIPFYVPPTGQHAHDIPNIIADALRKQDEEHNEALTATNLGYRPLTPPPDSNVQGAAMAPAPAPVPGLKRRPSSSPAAAHARRPRRRRPRPRTQSVISDGDSPIPPPRPQPAPFYPPRPVSPPYSFFGIIRAKAEKEKRDKEVKKKREKREQRRKKQGTPETIQNQDGDEKINSPKRAKGAGAKESSKPPSQRASSAPPLYQEPVQGLSQDELSSGSQHGYHPNSKHGRLRHKKHHRRLGEQHHRRKKKRSKYGMRDFFASLRRKLGNLLRLTLPAASSAAQSAPPRVDISNPTPARDFSGTQQHISESKFGTGRTSYQNRGRRRGGLEQPLPYFMHGGRSPAESWHSKLSRPRSRRRFTATVESAPGSGAPSPHIQTEEFPSVAQTVAGVETQRLSYHTGSAISIIARRFMGPFLSEPSDPSTIGNDLGQKRLSWRSHKLLTAGSRPATPPSSRNPSPGGRGRSRSRGQRVSIPGAYRSFSSSSMGLRSLYPDRRSRSASPPRVSSPVSSPVSPSPISPTPVSPPVPVPSSPDYGLADLFATPPSAGSPVSATPVRISSPDYSLPRLFASTPVSTGSNFGLWRLFGD
ncbi:hypothetical protein GGR58DRAFT_172352 [Xylaria digitata]|nr:hypothetical protein GGR58DRAFT_172352 [Xylaria digitata]